MFQSIGFYFGSILVVSLSFSHFVNSEVVECSTTDSFNNFTLTDYVRFQTPGYPQTMDNFSSTTLLCNARFMPATNGDYLWFTFLNGAAFELSISDGNETNSRWVGFDSNYEVSTFTSTTGLIDFEFLNDYNTELQWTAFDSIVLPFSPSLNTTCPFSNQIITLTNETFIPVSSDFGIFENSYIFARNCSWIFKNDDPTNYRFKIYIKQATPDYNVTIGHASNTYTLTTIDISNPIAHYFTADEFHIDLISLQEIVTSNGFFAIVSLVPFSPAYTEACQISTSEQQYTIITNIDFLNGYQPYTYCDYNIAIPEGHEALLDVVQFWVEAGVDILEVIGVEGLTFPLFIGSYNLKQQANGFVFQFTADGNTHQAGFTVHYNVIKCECANPEIIIPCDGYSQITPLPNNVGSYCDNQHCSYTISLNESCPTDYFGLQPFFIFRQNLDSLALFVDGELVQNFTFSSINNNNLQIYSRNNNVSIEFYSGNSEDLLTAGNPMWIIQTVALPSITINKVILNSTNPIHPIWLDNMNANEAITVCSGEEDDQGEALELVFTDGYDLELFNLYDSEGFGNFTGSLDSSTFPPFSNTSNNYLRHVLSSSGCFTIYRAQRGAFALALAFFRVQRVHTQYCDGIENIFAISDTSSLSMIAANSGECEMIILAPKLFMPEISIDNILTSSNSSFAFKSALNRKPYFQLNSDEASLWNNNILYTPALSITIPPSAGISIQVSLASDSGFIFDTNQNKKGLLVSQIYSGMNSTGFSTHLIYQIYVNNFKNVNFIVKDLYLNANVVLQNMDTGLNHTFVENDFYSTNGTIFNIYCNLTNDDGFRIEYNFDAAPVLTTTTTTTGTPSSTTELPNELSTYGSMSTAEFLPNTTSSMYISSTQMSTTSATTKIPTITVTSEANIEKINSIGLILISFIILLQM